MQRKLLHVSEDKVSYLQIIGFIVILIGLLYLLYAQLTGKLTGECIATIFFSIMLGFAFVFPDLLRDSNKGLSTMRIVVFMMINVICMLLLKIGWEQHDLKAIGLDQYWMGVIAFVFGAKATQTYFESKLAVPSALSSASNSAMASTQINTNQATANNADENLDGCGTTSTNLTANTALPASEGGMA
jgi:hypothetical protein